MNSPLSALIVDDETLARRLLRSHLRKHPDIAIVGESDNGEQALADIARLNPDLIFLDIQMPKLTGLEVLELSGRRSGVIFTTAYDEYALQAFERHAVDYLLKPYTGERLAEALSHARHLLGRSLPDALLNEAAAQAQRVLIRDRGQLIVVPVADIDCIEAQDDYIAIHAAGRTHLKTQSLNEIEAWLAGKGFVRVHRSWLINLARLKAIERQGKDGHQARLGGDLCVPVSRSGHARLIDAIEASDGPRP